MEYIALPSYYLTRLVSLWKAFDEQGQWMEISQHELFILGAHKACYIFGVGELVPVLTGVNGSAPLHRDSLIELHCVIDAHLKPL